MEAIGWTPRDGDTGPRGKDYHEQTEGRYQFSGHNCASPLPWIHPAILAPGSEAGEKPSQEVGAAGRAAGAAGEGGYEVSK